MSSRGRVVWIERGLFPIYFGFCPSKAAWTREMKRLRCDETYPTTAGACTMVKATGKPDGIVSCIVTLSEHLDRELRSDPLMIAGVLCHEAAHVWQSVRKEMAEKRPSIEFEAYALQYITQELCSAYRDTRGAKAARRPRPSTKKRRRT